MLYTHQVRSKCLPAIPHFDHSARVQVILKNSKVEETDLFRKILRHLKQYDVPPVIINTSFNGPGIPIVENTADVINEAKNLKLKSVVIAGDLHSVSYSIFFHFYVNLSTTNNFHG